MDKKKIEDLRTKILQGLNLTFKKLVEKKIVEDTEFVFSENGQIIKVKARELKNKS